MKIKYKFPALILYVNKVQKGKGYVVRGKCMGFIIIIGKSYMRDKGLLAHEITHAKQFLCHGFLIHSILTGLFRKYRLWAEATAYAEQWQVDKIETQKEDFIDRLWLFYKLHYSREYIKKYFLQKLET